MREWEISHSVPPSKRFDKYPSGASLIYTLDKNLVQNNWPYMRVKNTIKYLKLGSTKVCHYKGLLILAKNKGIHINELIKMNLTQYIGSDYATRRITKGCF